jgi:hypothetical protein
MPKRHPSVSDCNPVEFHREEKGCKLLAVLTAIRICVANLNNLLTASPKGAKPRLNGISFAILQVMFEMERLQINGLPDFCGKQL